MSGNDDESDRRRNFRVLLGKPFRVKAGSQQFEGTVKNISTGGAALEVEAVLKGGQSVSLEIEDMGSVEGRVSREMESGFVVEFDLEDDEEDRLLDEIMNIHSQVRFEDEGL